MENYFSMLKSRLQKLDGLTHEKIKRKYRNGYKRYTIGKNMKINLREYIIEQKNRIRKLKKYLP